MCNSADNGGGNFRRVMNTIRMNVISLNGVSLNLVGNPKVGGRTGGGGGGEPTPDIPEGYGLFMAMDGVFSAADGDFYVKL